MQAEWEPGPVRPQLAADVVDVWCADVSAGGEHERALLSDDERERAARFVRAEHGARWARARGILRVLLARYAEADPRALRFEARSHGKPRLAAAVSGREAAADATTARLRFNLSHSGDVALIAVALDREIGVDVELPRRTTDHVAIARRILGDQEADRLQALDPQDREREFLRAWVRWEAVLKCNGTGIGGADEPPSVPGPWVVELEMAPPAAAALAVEDGPCTVRCWHWPAAGA